MSLISCVKTLAKPSKCFIEQLDGWILEVIYLRGRCWKERQGEKVLFHFLVWGLMWEASVPTFFFTFWGEVLRRHKQYVYSTSSIPFYSILAITLCILSVSLDRFSLFSFSFSAPGSLLMFLTFIRRWIESHIWLIFKSAWHDIYLCFKWIYVSVSLFCGRERDWDTDLERGKRGRKGHVPELMKSVSHNNGRLPGI